MKPVMCGTGQRRCSDFTLFAPVLEKLVAYNRKFAGYYDSSKKPYDALLDEYERGADMAFLDTFFETVRERLVPLIHATVRNHRL